MGRKTRKGWAAATWLTLPIVAVLALVIFAGALNGLSTGRSQEERQQLEEALRRGCIACYAMEGRYPPDLEYLREHYGIQLDEERYTVIYDVSAPNLMPDITLLEHK